MKNNKSFLVTMIVCSIVLLLAIVVGASYLAKDTYSNACSGLNGDALYYCMQSQSGSESSSSSGSDSGSGNPSPCAGLQGDALYYCMNGSGSSSGSSSGSDSSSGSSSSGTTEKIINSTDAANSSNCSYIGGSQYWCSPSSSSNGGYVVGGGSTVVEKTDSSGETTYEQTTTSSNGNTTVHTYDSEGNVMTSVTTDSNGNVVYEMYFAVPTKVGKYEDYSRYYATKSTCEEKTGTTCIKIGNRYMSEYTAKHDTFYYSEEACENNLGIQCEESSTYPGYWKAPECDCNGGCGIQPADEANKGTPSDYSGPSAPLPPETIIIPEKKCWQCNVGTTKKYVIATNTSTAASATNGTKCVTVSDSYCSSENPDLVDPDNPVNPNENVIINPQTGTVAIIISWITGIIAIMYSIWYFVKYNKVNEK